MSKDYSEQQWEKVDTMKSETKASLGITGLLIAGIAFVYFAADYQAHRIIENEIRHCQNIIAWDYDKARGIYPTERQGYPARNAAEHEFCMYGEK